MLRTSAILRELVQCAMSEALLEQGVKCRPAGAHELERCRASAMSLLGNSATGRVHFAVEDAVLSAMSASVRRHQDLVNELANVVVGKLETELLRRGLAVQYSLPRPTDPAFFRDFDPGTDGVICRFETPCGRAVVAVQLNLGDGAMLEAFPTRRLPNIMPSNQNTLGTKRSGNVLVVDDSASARACVVEALEGAGFDVLEADSGTAALRLLADTPEVGIVFTDLHMPDMRGSELIRALKADRNFTGIPVVVFTASPASVAAEVDLSHLMTCLIKPVSPAAVISLARRVLAVAS